MSDGPLDTLYALQRNRRRRWGATLLAAVIGVGLATLHWSGLLVGGALVGWAWPTLGRATLAGLGFAVFVLVTFAISLALWRTVDPALGMGQITLVTVAIPLVLGTLGGLTRGLGRNAPGTNAPSDAPSDPPPDASTETAE